MSNKKEVYLTEKGLNEIKDELDNLKNVRRPANIQALKEARALGDLSENAEYDAARNEQAEIEARIQELEVMVENAVVIENIDTNVVGLGTKVTIEFVDDNDTDTYDIVGTKEADPFENKISNESPIAQAIIGKKVGDIATVSTDSDSYDVKIIEIKAQ